MKIDLDAVPFLESSSPVHYSSLLNSDDLPSLLQKIRYGSCRGKSLYISLSIFSLRLYIQYIFTEFNSDHKIYYKLFNGRVRYGETRICMPFS